MCFAGLAATLVKTVSFLLVSKEDTFPFRSGSETSSVILRVLNQNVLTLHVLASFCCNFCPNRVSIHYRRFENAILRFLINRKALLVKVCWNIETGSFPSVSQAAWTHLPVLWNDSNQLLTPTRATLPASLPAKLYTDSTQDAYRHFGETCWGFHPKLDHFIYHLVI